MGIIKKYKVVILVVMPVLILVLFRAFGTNHFKNDARRWAEPSVARSNIISEDQLGTLSGEKLIINLDKKSSGIEQNINNKVISADSILSKNVLNIIRKHGGPVLLFSSDAAVSARVWMILSQMGYGNIYIFTNDTDNEVLKNKFRPDTVIRPEL
jgi:hypothetical protein